MMAVKPPFGFRAIADIDRLTQISCMNPVAITTMRASLWFLFSTASAIALYWLLLLLSSGFEIWRESNGIGLSLQAVTLLFPVALFVGLKKSSENPTGTVATFLVGWGVAASALLFFDVL